MDDTDLIYIYIYTQNVSRLLAELYWLIEEPSASLTSYLSEDKFILLCPSWNGGTEEIAVPVCPTGSEGKDKLTMKY